MSRSWLTVSAALLMVSATLAADGSPRFAAGPTATRVGGKVTVSFTASRDTDVAVYIQDAAGKVVRHLAAGVLGPKAPPPLKSGLVQAIEWDGTDDTGKPAAGGPFKVRVALGLRPTFDRMIGNNPAAIGDVRGLAVGPDGTVYVFSTFSGFATGGSHGSVVAFDRDGNYLRQVVPYPANLPEERLQGVKRLEVAPGVKVPFVYNAETRALIPGLGGENGMFRGVVTRDGHLALAGVMASARDTGQTVQMIVVNTDGSAPPGGVLGPVLGDRTRQPPSLALSPDEKTIYAVGLRDTPWADKGKFVGTVYSCAWSDKEVKPLIAEGLNEPRSIAVDKDGNLYVADKGNDRIAVFKANGSPLGELKCDRPERVEVHPKTGAVYVLGGEKVDALSKFASFKDATLVAKATLPAFKHRLYTCMMALDGSRDPAVLWFGSVQGYFARFGLLRLEDKGDSFAAPVDVIKLPANSKPTAGRASDLTLAGDLLMVWPQRGGPFASFNARTGESQKPPWPMPRVDHGAGWNFTLGADGRFYLGLGYPDTALRRYDSEMKPLPFAEGKDGAIPNCGANRTRLRGISVDARGNIYLLRQRTDFPAPKSPQEPYFDANALALYGPDGKAINDRLIDSEIRNLSSVRVDPAGNIYVALGAHPGDETLPANLKGQVPDGRRDPDAERGHNYYPLMYGSIVKFGPKGGSLKVKDPGQAAAAHFAYDRKLFIAGQQWMFFGASIVPAWVHGGFKPDICACESPRFDVDGFGRSFFPDACGFRVGVLDTAGNLIGWFGQYGNQDSAGPGSAIPTPEIPLGWVQAVAVNDEAVFVGDRLCQRVVRVKLQYAAEAVCDVEQGAGVPRMR